MLNAPGQCLVSGAQVFEVVSVDPEGNPTRLGGPFDTAMRVTCVLLSGRWTRYTIAADHVAGLEAKLAALHARNALAMRHQIDGVQAPRTSAQQATMEAMFDAYLADIPLGVLFVEPWTEVYDG